MLILICFSIFNLDCEIVYCLVFLVFH